ncbi:MULTISPECIES: glycosyl hydrolase family 28-related protein [Burkholderia]|uniref:glycosyl hydrolase family 28-related protein n=1 Tax=Burkholderia TaxID=32008 RepID=UPI0015C60D0F|nr:MULTISPECIES: glycosyl hydrolase family 28-related protein [Burkholderia]MBY4728345.1 glycoside hydrolase family 55 protein [Burkholderia contaminans]MCI3970572.1 glycoside hydrolase family 55 protein [Burkholderia sp. HI4860]MDN7792508.1 glycosyl hydrolase family 28-related protein [Burkholderia contaminans]
MKRRIGKLFCAIAFALSLAFVVCAPARAQFVPGQILTASQLTNMFTSVSQFRSTAPGSVSRTVMDKLQDVVNFRDFGGKCDGTTNDDAAMNAALSNLTAGELLVFPAGTCVFSTPKALPIVQNVSIRGAGARQTVLLYTGSNTTSDIWTVGDGTTSMTGWSISGLRFDSTTTMTAGAALHLKRMQNGSELFDVDAGVFGQPTRKLYNGVWLDNVNVFKYSKFNIQVQNQGLMMNGSPTSDEGSDIFLDDGVVTFSNIGYHVGGGQGGVYFGKILAYGNGTNYQVDNALAARLNREIFFSDQCISDGSYGYGVWINDSLTSNAPIVMNGAFGSAGVLGGSPNGIEIYIQKWPNGRISLGPGQLYNATSDGMRVDDASTIITIDSTRHIFNNGGYGVNATVPTTNIYSLSQYAASNTLGNYSSNVKLGALNIGGALSGTTLTNTAQQIDKAYTYTAPASGATVAIASGTQTAVIDPAGTLAALTITLPACSSAYDGSIARFSSTQTITALTLGAASGSVAAPATSLAAGAGHGYLCRGTNTTWYPLY